MKWSLAYTFFRSLTLDHLERSLYSVARQTAQPDELVFFDNNTDYTPEHIKAVIARHFDLGRWTMHFEKHGDPAKTTASWGQNRAIERCEHEFFVLGKADLIYDFRFFEWLIAAQQGVPRRLSTTWVYQMGYFSQAAHGSVDHAADLEPLGWREDPRRLLANRAPGWGEHKETQHDAPSFMTSKTAMAAAGWYDETLTKWGYWQQGLQHMMLVGQTEFKVVPEWGQFHMMHGIEGGERDPKPGFAQWMESKRMTGKGA